MSSCIRTHGKITKANKFDNISTPSYNDNVLGYSVPLPFVVSNQTLDILITNNDVQNFVNNGSTPDDDTKFQAKQMGGFSNILALGPTFVTYLRNLIRQIDSLGSAYAGPLSIYTNPVMTKVQIAQPNNVQGLTFENVFGVNEQPPSSDEYVGGNDANNYFASWVFVKPLTVKYTSSASATGFKYLTFSTHYDGD